MERLLPRLQLVFAVLFAAAALVGPFVFAQVKPIIYTAAFFGLLLGLITFRIGWRLEVEKSPVVYPFTAWSQALLKPFVPHQQAKALKKAKASLPAAGTNTTSRVLGIASLTAGLLLVVVLFSIAASVLTN